jgi:DNA-binding MarR family transcriptional regulator
VSSRQTEVSVGITGAQLFVLQKVREAEAPLSLSQLAERTLTHLSSVSTVVSRLVDSGFLAKAPAPDDARRSEISLTDKGRKFLQGQPKTAQEKLIGALERLPAKDAEQLAKLLGQVIIDAGFATGETVMIFEEERK